MVGQCDDKQQARADKRNAKGRLFRSNESLADREERRSARNTKDRDRRAYGSTEQRRQRKDTKCEKARGARGGDVPSEKVSADRRRAAARKRHQDKRETENQQLRRLGECTDRTGDEIRPTVFGSAVATLEPLLLRGSVVMISCAKIHRAKRK
ncbi:hypothetical protein DVH05_017027 [Phytophthora capsici]|nr:hypothetical protein DVH05_017027 [Phytophthora capsici]